MSALDSLDSAVVADEATADKVSPAEARREADARDPTEVIAARKKRWEAIVPEGLTGRLREDLEASLDMAHFALGWPVNKLASLTIEASNQIAKEQGLEPDDPKVVRATAVRIIKTVEAAALSANPFADVSPDIERYINKASAYGRTLGLSPEQIGLALKDALLQAEGDKVRAAGLFASFIADEDRERGHRGSVSLDSLLDYADRGSVLASEDPAREDYTGVDLEDDRTSRLYKPDEPANEPYPPDRLVTVYDARDDEGKLKAYAMRADELQAEVREREILGRRADRQLAIVDKVAATMLKPLDYAVYRIMRDEAYRIGAKTTEVDALLSHVVKEKLQYDRLQGAELAIARVKTHLREFGLRDVGELSEKAKRRISMPTDQAVAEGLAAAAGSRKREKRRAMSLE